MATISASVLNFSGIKRVAYGVSYAQQLPFQNHNHYTYRLSKFLNGTALFRRNLTLQVPYFLRRGYGPAHILSAGRDYQLNYDEYNNSRTEPFWLNLLREAIWNTRNLLIFLSEQPGQLKYIEWPSFHDTLKTAILTLVIVAVLIVALSSVDSALSFLLALFLGRKA